MRISLILLAASAAVPCLGCGYSFEPVFRKTARRIHLPVMINDTRRHGLETLLTRALSEELRQAGLRPASREDCDAVLECSITSAPGETLAEDPAGAVPEKRLSIEVRYRLLDRQGALITDGSASGAGETISSGPDRAGSGVERAVAECARALVRALEPRPGGH